MNFFLAGGGGRRTYTELESLGLLLSVDCAQATAHGKVHDFKLTERRSAFQIGKRQKCKMELKETGDKDEPRGT